MGKKSKNAARANATATAPDGDVPVVGMREPVPVGPAAGICVTARVEAA